jgi:hypothetical protein
VLTAEEIDAFVADGFVKVTGAFPREVGDACRAELWRATGCDPDDPATWTRPVVRLDHFTSTPFRRAANAPALHEAFDQLAGPGGWVPRGGLGTVPVRFPSPEDPGDAGWHLEGSFAGPDGGVRVNLRSRGRALLMLFLFSDVGEDDAPTRIRVGSHLDVPPVLEPHGDGGMAWMDACVAAVPRSEGRPEALATGAPGDVYLCHPFVVHAAQPHRGPRPRFMAQPPLEPRGDLDLDAADPTPVAAAVLRGLAAARG